MFPFVSLSLSPLSYDRHSNKWLGWVVRLVIQSVQSTFILPNHLIGHQWKKTTILFLCYFFNCYCYLRIEPNIKNQAGGRIWHHLSSIEESVALVCQNKWISRLYPGNKGMHADLAENFPHIAILGYSRIQVNNLGDFLWPGMGRWEYLM